MSGAEGIRAGDRVVIDGRPPVVLGASGTAIRFAGDDGVVEEAAVADLAGSGRLRQPRQPGGRPGPQIGLAGLPPEMVERARWWEDQIIEVVDGTCPDAPAGTPPRPECDVGAPPRRWSRRSPKRPTIRPGRRRSSSVAPGSCSPSGTRRTRSRRGPRCSGLFSRLSAGRIFWTNGSYRSGRTGRMTGCGIRCTRSGCSPRTRSTPC